jgi:RTX calcium-binding nonapeptide repeat (4 copies)
MPVTSGTLVDPSTLNAPLSNAQTSTINAIGTAGENDLFAITLTAGVRYTFEANGLRSGGGTLVDPELRVYSVTTILFQDIYSELAFNDDVRFNNIDSQITFTPATSGTYYLDVRSHVSTGTGSYTLLAVRGDGSQFTNDSETVTLSASANAYYVRGMGGNDTIYGTTGYENLFGDDGNDTIYTGGGTDNVYGGNGNDALYGSGYSSEYLWGGNGDDILNAGGGADRMYGDNGNDTIYYDAADGLDVFGGNDFDTLIVQYADGVPYSFNLVTQQFERAILDRFDTGNAFSWSRALYIYNTAWLNTSQEIIYDNASREVINYDYNNSQTWSRSTNYYNTSNTYYAQRILYDTGASDTQYVDYANNQTWSSYIDYVNAGGQQYARRYFQDAGPGNYDTQYFDFNNSQTWTTQTEFRYADGAMYARQTINDGNSYRNEYYDVRNTQTYTNYYEDYSAGGTLLHRYVLYDNGTSTYF